MRAKFNCMDNFHPIANKVRLTRIGKVSLFILSVQYGEVQGLNIKPYRGGCISMLRGDRMVLASDLCLLGPRFSLDRTLGACVCTAAFRVGRYSLDIELARFSGKLQLTIRFGTDFVGR